MSFDTFLSSTPTIKELTEHVDVGTKWFIVGTMLDLDQRRLRSIIEGQTGHTHKMIDMFNLWLTTTPTASRRQILEALRINVVGENSLAGEYEKHLKKMHETTCHISPSTEAVSILQRNIQSLNEALVSPVQVSQLLYSKRCISEATLDEMERIDQRRSLDDKKTTLLTAIQETVSSNYRKLKDIATVLSDVEETRDIANNIIAKYEEKIPQEDDSTVVQPQEAVGGNEGCASDILRNNYSALSQSITEPVRMATLLYKEVIFDEALSCVVSTRGSISDSRAVLLKAVRDAVHSNYKHLELFVTVLRKFSETAHIGDAIFDEYKHNFSTDENIEEMETYLTEKRGSQHISSDSDSEGSAILGHRVPFPPEMRKEFKEMRINFGSTFYRVRVLFSKKWAKSWKNINKVKALLADIYPDLKSELSVATTIDGVLDVVKRKCSIVDVHLLEVIAVHFKVKEAIKIIIKHKEAAKEFCESVSVSLSSNETLQAIPMQHLPCETVTFVLSWDADDTTLQDVYDVLLELGPLPNYHIKVTDVCKGRSVVVTCYCPAEYTTLLIMTVLDKIEILQEKGLKEFKVGNCTIWNKVSPVMTTETPKKTDKLTKETVSNYEDMERELLSIRQQLAEKEKQIQELIKEKDQPDDMDELKRSLVTKNQEIDHLKVSIKEKDYESDSKIQELQSIIHEKEEEAKAKIEELERSLSLASDEKSELKRNLETKYQEIDHLKVSIKEKDDDSDSKIQELQSIIHEKEEELLSSQQSLKRKEKEANTLSEGITAEEKELASFRKLSEEQVQEIVALRLKLTDNQKDIAEKESVIKSTNEELSSTRRLLSDTLDQLELQRKSIDELGEKIGTLSRISKMKDREIEDLKARLYPRNEQDMITSIVKWSESEVRLTSPSAEQCTDVLTRIDYNHRHVYLSDSSSDVAQLLIVPLLQKRNISTLYIFSTSLRCDFIDLFSSQMLDNNTLESLYLNHNSIDDDGVIILVQSLKHNKKLQYLSLDFNTGITSLSVPSLAEFIRINCTLSVLYISHTSIDADGVLELVGSLKFNARLGKIVVDQKHKAICSQFVGKTNRLDFSYTTGITKF